MVQCEGKHGRIVKRSKGRRFGEQRLAGTRHARLSHPAGETQELEDLVGRQLLLGLERPGKQQRGSEKYAMTDFHRLTMVKV